MTMMWWGEEDNKDNEGMTMTGMRRWQMVRGQQGTSPPMTPTAASHCLWSGGSPAPYNNNNIYRDGMANNEQWGDNNDGNEKMMNGEGMMGGCHHQWHPPLWATAHRGGESPAPYTNNNIYRDGMANNKQLVGEDDNDGHYHHSTSNHPVVGMWSNRGRDNKDDNDGDERKLNGEGTRRWWTVLEQCEDMAPTPPRSRPPA